MITFFCDFWQFSAKIFGGILKYQYYDIIFEETSNSLSKKTPIFSQYILGENILKITTLIPA
jgi:hypothetical protein